MKIQLSVQEKLWDLRKEKNFKLEYVASEIGISPSTLSNYENNENKEMSISVLSALSKFYGVSLDWLAGITEIKDSKNTEISDLKLDDETISILKSQKINNRLLCEIIKNPDFIKLMTDTEIYVDGIATMQIKNMNDWLDAVRLQIIQQNNPQSNDLYLKVLENAHLQEEEYFFHTIHNDLDNIIRKVRENHQNDNGSAPMENTLTSDKKIQRFLQNLKFKSNPVEEFWKFFCDELQIKYDNLSVQEHETMKNIFKRSKLLKSIPSNKNKARK